MILFIGGSAGSNIPTHPRPKYGHLTTSFGIIDAERKLGIVIDHGNGIQLVCRRMRQVGIKTIAILQTHFHADHVEGLHLNPYLLEKDLKVEVILWPELDSLRFEDLFAERFRFSNWPLSPATRGISHRFQSFRPGTSLKVFDIEVDSFLLHHSGGAVGFRFNLPGGGVVLASDSELSSPVELDYAHFVEGARILVADVQYRQLEYEGKAPIGNVMLGRHSWGHSTPEMVAGALALCKRTPTQLVITHHDPGRSDNGLDQFHEEALELLPGCLMAKWGDEFEL